MNQSLLELTHSYPWFYIISIGVIFLFSIILIFLLRSVIVADLVSKFLPAVILKPKKGRLQVVSCSSDLRRAFKNVEFFQDISENLTDEDILSGDNKRFVCLLNATAGRQLTYIYVKRISLIWKYIFLTFSDPMPQLADAFQSSGTTILTDHQGHVLYDGDDFKRGYFFPLEMLGDYPDEGEWDYSKVVPDVDKRSYFVNCDLQQYWSAQMYCIDKADIVLWQRFSLNELKSSLESLPFPAAISFYNYAIQNGLKDSSPMDTDVENGMILRSALTWHEFEIRLPVKFGIATYEDRRRQQAKPLEAMMQRLLVQRWPDPETFLNKHLPDAIAGFFPRYVKITVANSDGLERGEIADSKDQKLPDTHGVSKVYEYSFSDPNGENKLLMQLDYPLSGPVRAFFDFCIKQYLPLMSAGKKYAFRDSKRRIEEFQFQLKSAEAELKNLQEGISLYQSRVIGLLDELNRKALHPDIARALPEAVKHKLEEAVQVKKFDLVLHESEVPFIENIDLAKVTIDTITTRHDQLQAVGISGYRLPPKNVVFMVTTNTRLMEEAFEIILLQIFPRGRGVDGLILSISQNTISIGSEQNRPLNKSFTDLKLEMRFLDLVMQKSGLELELGKTEILISRK